MELRNLRGLTGVGIVPYDVTGSAPGEHLGLPGTSATLVVDLADGLVLSSGDSPVTTTFRCCIAGIHLRPVTIHHNGVQRGVQLDLSPAAVRALLGMPAGELAGQMVELSQIDTAFARLLHERLAQTPAGERGAVCAAMLAETVSEDTPRSDALSVWEVIARRRGDVTVSELVESSGWSARHLTAMFNAEFGIGPKQAARLTRFETARARLESGHRAVDVAASCGYADQAHMSREFTELTGYSPRALLKRRAEEFA
ncbi:MULTISPECIES: helix-turn-helix domain-containing protein [Gordonia]|uniref:Putative AraC family transcriptional regulator n=1 Tax=Gordonia sihwensis NBRC 108236 TaxID=1223544 RepID=L7LMD2_9ACTN|nr:MULTISPECIES: helix-turn-helix transcriptional regulator [Gordonia]AUH67692.1 AraC family transcriptional regulator [Gordonia sp. YC-JH1]MBY4568817.1 AraC family transcriptional regulator [Gordonia sihwensis]GAC62014.1 putative AraC family transcriptional regulator [Gordonia sihwensis NBRC 108236]